MCRLGVNGLILLKQKKMCYITCSTTCSSTCEFDLSKGPVILPGIPCVIPHVQPPVHPPEHLGLRNIISAINSEMFWNNSNKSRKLNTIFFAIHYRIRL